MSNVLMIMYGVSVGGAELQFLELANHLSKRNSIRIICLGGNGALNTTHVFDGIDVKVYPYSSGVSALFGLLRALFENARYPAGVIVTTSFFGNLLGYAFSLLGSVKLVSLQTVSVCMHHPIIDRFILRKFNTLIAGANDIKDYLVSHGQNENKICVVHNWIDFSKRIASEDKTVVRRRMNLTGKLVIGCVGRLHSQKGQLYLVRAFSNVVGNYPDIVLLLVGDGPSRGVLKDEVDALNLNDSVMFTGTISGQEYNDILGIIDIYVQPSVFEGLPRTLLDAMYMGKAIIASDINGNREAIEHGKTGLLVPSENVDSLYEALVRLIENPDIKERFGKSANEAAILKFDMNKQFERIDEIISPKYFDVAN